MQTVAPQIANKVRKKMAREGVTGSKEELNATFSKRFNEAVSERRIYSPDGLSCQLTLGESGKEEAAIEARNIANVDHGRTRVDAIARVCVVLVGVFTVDPAAFRSRLGDVPDVDFAGESRPDRGHPHSHRDDHIRERRVREVVYL